MHVTFVKKILANGETCHKCLDIESRLKESGYWSRIDNVCVADEREPEGLGMQLAREFDVKVAPFFLVRNGEETKVYSIYLQLIREVFQAE